MYGVGMGWWIILVVVLLLAILLPIAVPIIKEYRKTKRDML